MGNSDSGAMREVDVRLDAPMTDVWDIAQYVEAHPDNHAQRWRLAKKLYMAWEYRLALEHLQVLKNEWERRINVDRYLAATYYRLSRYNDAVHELESAIAEWPEELGLHEQLARTLDVADKRPEAIEVWEKIALQDPEHPYAKRAIKHLRASEQAEYDSADSQTPAAAAAAALTEASCPHCGAMNSPEFTRCWQCHGVMAEEGQGEEEPSYQPVVRESDSSWGLVAGLTIAGLLALSVYLTLQAFAAQPPNGQGDVPETLSEFFSSTLLMTRLIIGLTALIVWPIFWRVAAVLVGLDEVQNDLLYRCGAVLACVTYIISWVPGSLIYLIVIVPAVVSGALAFGAVKGPFPRTLALWAVQGAAMTIVVLAFLAGGHGFGIVTDVPAMFRFASREVEASIEREAMTPFGLGLRWESSGSKWLDKNASAVRVSVKVAPHTKPIYIELLAEGQTLEYEELTAQSHAFSHSPIDPSKAYQLEFTGEEGIDTTVSVSGILEVGPAVPK